MRQVRATDLLGTRVLGTRAGWPWWLTHRGREVTGGDGALGEFCRRGWGFGVFVFYIGLLWALVVGFNWDSFCPV